MKYPILFIFLTTYLIGFAQKSDTTKFIAPFDFPSTFSGNFGEIRSTHFHGGLDFRTNGAINKPIRAINNGYISRARVTNGSGYIVEVVYDNGYTTINRHLEGLLTPIKEIIENLQYQEESYEVDKEFIPNEFPVKQGDIIGLSGNRGYSFGPHLHLDVLETATGDYIDPTPLFSSVIKDTRAPRAVGLMLVPQLGRGIVAGKKVPHKFDVNSTTTITAWGEIGAAIRAYDYMDGSENKCGVYSVQLFVDDFPVFQSIVDRFSYDESRQVNTWALNGYMRSFQLPGNKLRMFTPFNDNKGLITIDEERVYNFEYKLTDASGNQSSYKFKVKGEKKDVSNIADEAKVLKWDAPHVVNEPGMSIYIPKGALHDDFTFQAKTKVDSNAISYSYELAGSYANLFKSAELQIGLRNECIADTTKYYIARVNGNRRLSVGGKYKNGYIKAMINTFGQFTVAVDTIPPVITPVNRNSWGKSNKIAVQLSDKETGIARCSACVDGKYILFYRPNMMQSQYICELNPKYVEKGKKHTLEIIAVDACGNQSILTETFFW